jgi:hypothetical protein
VGPVRALRGSVESIAGGHFGATVPFTDSSDETGGLARSIDILRRGAAAMEDQRWIKASVGNDHRRAARSGHVRRVRRTAAFEPAAAPRRAASRPSMHSIPARRGYAGSRSTASRSPRRSGSGSGSAKGLAGECARAAAPVRLTGLPPDYLRISSALGAAAPEHAYAWPVASGAAVLAVAEVASFRPLGAREQALVEELLPSVALSLEVLQRNLRTQELLLQTRDQREALRRRRARSRPRRPRPKKPPR